MKIIAVAFILLLVASPAFAASADQYVKEGYRQLDSGKYQGAARKFREAIAVDPRNFAARKGLGLAWYKAGSNAAAVNVTMLEDAVAAFREALQIKPDAETCHYIGMAELALGRPEEAEIAQGKLSELDRKQAADLAAKIAAYRKDEAKRPKYGAGVSPEKGAREKHPVRNTARPASRNEGFTGVVEIYVTDWCGYCKRAKAHLDRKGIAYAAHDIEKDSGARARHRELGGRGVPLIIIGSKKMSGYSPERLDYYLDKEGLGSAR